LVGDNKKLEKEESSRLKTRNSDVGGGDTGNKKVVSNSTQIYVFACDMYFVFHIYS